MTRPIAPGSRIGILGGGQLGRMTAIAAAQLGYASHVLSPDEGASAGQVAERWLQADYRDLDALNALASACAVVTIEFENVPVEALDHLAARVPTRPAAAVLAVTQDRLVEKRFVEGRGIATTPFTEVEDIETARGWLGSRAGVLKTRRMGYDGKGQRRVAGGDELAAAAGLMGDAALVLEREVDLAGEYSVIVARSPSGALACFPPVRNEHADHILKRTIAPADLPDARRREAIEMASELARALELQGLLAVEMFLDTNERLMVNELAPRPHNSGHWTIDAAMTSQFEQLVRAICDLPLGSVEARGPAVMENLLGEEVARWPEFLALPNARLHLYGKAEARPGRKLGHVTFLSTDDHPAPGPASADASGDDVG